MTKPIREFARYDKGDWRNFAIETKQLISLGELATKVSGLGVHQNSVEVYWCSLTKMVVGVLTILDRVKRSVVIAQDYSGPDSILYVVEDTHLSKQLPKSVFIESAQKQFSLSLLDVKYFSSANYIYHYFQNELDFLMEKCYPIDAITARLFQQIEKNNKKNLKLDQVSLEEYLNLLLSFFRDLGKVNGISVDMNKARSQLLNYGFANLTHQHIGKLYTDPDVDFLMADAFQRTLKDFHCGVFGAD